MRSIEDSVLFQRVLDALSEETFSGVEEHVADLGEEFDLDDKFDELFLVRAVGDATFREGASSARGALVRALTLLRSRATPLPTERFNALAELLRVAICAAFDTGYFAQGKAD